MAHFVKKRHRKHKRAYLERISRIPYNNETIEPYKIVPSPISLEHNLLQMLYRIFNTSIDSIDGQNGNMFDEYIDSWNMIAKKELDIQKVKHGNKISDLIKLRAAVLNNANDWLDFDSKTLKNIQNKLNEALTENQNFKTK